MRLNRFSGLEVVLALAVSFAGALVSAQANAASLSSPAWPVIDRSNAATEKSPSTGPPASGTSYEYLNGNKPASGGGEAAAAVSEGGVLEFVSQDGGSAPIWRGNDSLGDTDWREQWGLAGWNASSGILTNGFWGENELDVVPDPHDASHLVLRVTYPVDGVTTESGTGMLFAPEFELSNPRAACLSYKLLFESDFDFGTVGGKLPGLFGFDPSSGLPLDPLANGVWVEIRDAAETPVLDVQIPGGAFDAATMTGWSSNSSGTTHTFESKDSVDGVITKVVVKWGNKKEPGKVSFQVAGKRGSLQVDPTQLPLTAQVRLDTEQGNTEQCAQLAFNGPGQACVLDASRSKLQCR